MNVNTTKNLMAKALMTLGAVLTLTACAVEPALMVNTESKQAVQNYTTFSWVKDDPMFINGDFQPSQEISATLMESIKAELETKGYRFTEERTNADLVVLFSVGANEKIEFKKHPNYFSENARWMSNFQDGDVGEVTEVKVLLAGIAIDIFDREKREAVWYGSAKRKLNTQDEAVNALDSDDLSKSVQVLLTEFPKAS
ncbi:DUF4136 domain-containing protein [Glaciecola sp. MF2-115]|uniref:DUF4136 domain-containing protein n=1 Tax=Glaciecola sp. MF2-115 TaxID=3384827 RepID=UPI0039A1248F